MINLEKGQSINLNKTNHDLSSVLIGLGWDMRKHWVGASSKHHYDLDAYAVLLDENNKFLGSEYCIYYNNLRSQDGKVAHSGDNLTGEGVGDDEQLIVKLDTLDEKFHKIAFGVNIYQAKERKQHFGMIKNAYIRAVDAKGTQMLRFMLSDNEQYDDKCSMIFAEVHRDGENWNFSAIGEAFDTDKIAEVIGKKYV